MATCFVFLKTVRNRRATISGSTRQLFHSKHHVGILNQKNAQLRLIKTDLKPQNTGICVSTIDATK